MEIGFIVRELAYAHNGEAKYVAGVIDAAPSRHHARFLPCSREHQRKVDFKEIALAI